LIAPRFLLLKTQGSKQMISKIIAFSLACLLAFAPLRASADQSPAYVDTAVAVSGLGMMGGYNNALLATQSCNSGTSAPANLEDGAVAGQCWADTSVAGYLIIRRYDGTALQWIEVARIDTTNHVSVPQIGGGTIPTLASSTTTDFGSVPQAVKTISGTTTITSFGSSARTGTRHTAIFAGVLDLTHNATSLILPGAATITTAAGDLADAIYLGGGNWRVVNYTRANGNAVANPAEPLGSVKFGVFSSVPTGYVYGYGQAISRASFPGYLATASKAVTATRTSGNATLTSVSDTSQFGAGMPIEGSGIAAGCTIVSVTSNTIVTNSTSCVTANGATTVTVFLTGYGTAGTSSTVGVFNCAGVMLAGRTNLSGTDNANITTSGVSIDGTAVNATGGAQTVTLAQTALPNATLTATGTISTGGGLTIGLPSGATSIATRGDLASFSSYPVGQYSLTTFTGGATSSLNGGVTQTAVNKMPPTRIADCIVRVSP
jgi:hypothetical protein